jgi:hypothetical protein
MTIRADTLSAAVEDVGSALVNGFEEFQPVAERILSVEAAHSRHTGTLSLSVTLRSPF